MLSINLLNEETLAHWRAVAPKRPFTIFLIWILFQIVSLTFEPHFSVALTIAAPKYCVSSAYKTNFKCFIYCDWGAWLITQSQRPWSSKKSIRYCLKSRTFYGCFWPRPSRCVLINLYNVLYSVTTQLYEYISTLSLHIHSGHITAKWNGIPLSSHFTVP